ncbi:TetR/AcrR family transcriptional regulator [Pseudoalteromonas sp. N1230-9]|uniref:TetR/AcrR family transcriptional regulator n=1 Tax=Pseudoalteromonas sp. N1230-9 TaxID=2907156 RepID=UPI002B309190|nr:TetR/AcrR family transcriptional regulator [Pseudoalteromonas sp. N1230-9]
MKFNNCVVKMESNKEIIIQTATKMLSENGNQGLTLRKVAEKSGVTLSNVQYHFGDRDGLIVQVIDSYLEVCLDHIRSSMSDIELKNNPQAIKNYISNLLALDDIQDWCEVFREIWAISCRSEKVLTSLENYYKKCGTELELLLISLGFSEQKSKVVVSLLIPFIEGFSITSNALPLPKTEVISLIINLLVDEIK